MDLEPKCKDWVRHTLCRDMDQSWIRLWYGFVAVAILSLIVSVLGFMHGSILPATANILVACTVFWSLYRSKERYEDAFKYRGKVPKCCAVKESRYDTI